MLDESALGHGVRHFQIWKSFSNVGGREKSSKKMGAPTIDNKKDTTRIGKGADYFSINNDVITSQEYRTALFLQMSLFSDSNVRSQNNVSTGY